MDAATMKRRRIMAHKPRAIRFLLVILVLLLTTPAWAVPLTGYLEGTAASGWQGNFAVQLTDGTVVTGVDQITLGASFSSLPLTTVILNLSGDAVLGSIGTVSWGAQPVWAFAGDTSPTAAVLAHVTGVLGGTPILDSSFAFGFNGTLTSTFLATSTGQALGSLRLDFTSGAVPPERSIPLVMNGVKINDGVPVALGTPLTTAPASVPEPSSVLLLSLGIVGLLGLQRMQKNIGSS
jgi:PEP-CTERM motif-containing protein